MNTETEPEREEPELALSSQCLYGLDADQIHQIKLNGTRSLSHIGIQYPHNLSELCLELRASSILVNLQPTSNAYCAEFNIHPDVIDWFQALDRQFRKLVDVHDYDYVPMNPERIDLKPTLTQFGMQTTPVPFETIQSFCTRQWQTFPNRTFSVQLTLMLRHLVINDFEVSPKLDIIGMTLINEETPVVAAKPLKVKPKRKPITWNEGRDILVDQDFKCNNDNCRKKLDKTMQRDHTIPLHLGGADAMYNWQWLCPNCHALKSKSERDAMNHRY